MKFPCRLCNRKYFEEDIGIKILASSGVCICCYSDGLNSKFWCFGKNAEYNPRSPLCSSTCPDRVLCRLIVIGEVALSEKFPNME